MPEVMEFHRMAGDIDYMLRVAVPNMQAYDAFYKRLIDTMPLKNVTSRFAMERIKSTTAYPLPAGRETQGASARRSADRSHALRAASGGARPGVTVWNRVPPRSVSMTVHALKTAKVANLESKVSAGGMAGPRRSRRLLPADGRSTACPT